MPFDYVCGGCSAKLYSGDTSDIKLALGQAAMGINPYMGEQAEPTVILVKRGVYACAGCGKELATAAKATVVEVEKYEGPVLPSQRLPRWRKARTFGGVSVSFIK
jgi:DNA-directed RNA polymerase subunit RPC12/RpoP